MLVIVESGAPLLTSIISIMKLGHLKDSARARPQNDDDDVVASLLFQHVDPNYEGGRYLFSTGFISFRPRVTSISRLPSSLPIFGLDDTNVHAGSLQQGTRKLRLTSQWSFRQVGFPGT